MPNFTKEDIGPIVQLDVDELLNGRIVPLDEFARLRQEERFIPGYYEIVSVINIETEDTN